MRSRSRVKEEQLEWIIRGNSYRIVLKALTFIFRTKRAEGERVKAGGTTTVLNRVTGNRAAQKYSPTSWKFTTLREKNV